MLSGFSLIVAVILFNLSILGIAFLRRKTSFLVYYSTNALVLLALLSALRLFLPLDFATAKVINSYNIVPSVTGILNTMVFPGTPKITIVSLVALLWIGGAVFVLAKAGWSLFHGWRRRKSWKRVSCPQAERLLESLGGTHADLIVSPNVYVPMMTGFFKPHVYLPELKLPDESLSVVLRHELQHFKLRDTWIKLFYLILTAIFWWNPIVHKFQRELDNLLELRCDMAMSGHMDEHERIEYFNVILEVIRQAKNRTPQDNPLVTTFSKESSEAFLDQRMKLILRNPPRWAKLTQALAMLVVIAVFVASFFVIIQPAYDVPSSDEAMPVYVITEDNAYISVKNGIYSVYVNGEYFADTTPEQAEVMFPDLEIIVED